MTSTQTRNYMENMDEKMKLGARIEKLREALKFYADRAKYLDHAVNISIPGNKKKTCSIEDDFGQKARNAQTLEAE